MTAESQTVFLRVARQIAGRSTKRHFRSLVADAYDHPEQRSHTRIRRAAETWYGRTRSAPLERHWSELFIDLTYHAQLDLFHRGLDLDLGASRIGFDDLTLNCRSSDSNSSVVYLYGFSDNLTYFELYRSCVRPGSVAIDVGANLGIHSLVLSRCVGERGTVIAFEPSSTIHARLVENLETNNASNVVTRNIGVWETPGSAGFEPRGAEFNIGKGTVCADASSQVPVTTLDHETAPIKGPIDLVKIDVEGAELPVIKGATRMLAEHRPTVITEFNPHRYSLKDLVEQFPYESRCYKVPYTFWVSLAPIREDDFEERADVLIAPTEKNADRVTP